MLFGKVYAQQSTELEKQLAIEASIVSIGLSYELPISEKILTEFSAGFGSAAYKHLGWDLGIYLANYTPYSKIAIKRYYNRDNRIAKGKEINDNRGNFIGFQNKIMYGNDTEGAVLMINELHWGVQTEIAKNLLLTFHIGLGHFHTRDTENRDIAPTLGLKIKYVF